ncbi:MAG: hypothetical protein AAGA87_05685 [Pseudomonadota bacterium]
MTSGTSYTLPQPGKRPLAFAGSEIAMAMSFTPDLPYWYEINLYRSNDEQFIVAIRQFFQSENEKDTVKSWSFPTIEHALSHIEDYDAGHDVPVPHGDFAAMAPAEMAAHAMHTQAQIEEARAHFAGLVGEMFFEIDAAQDMAA